MAFDLDDEKLKATRRMNGSDKNVVCMEEDVKHIEYVLDLYKENGEFGGRYISGNLFEKDFIAIEHLIKEYKELKEIEQIHRQENGELREQVKELEEENRIFALEGCRVRLKMHIDKNYIPVSLVEETIEKLKENGYWNYLEERDLETTIDVLQELLEKRK